MRNLSRLVVIIFCALAAGPILWHLASSLKDAAEVTQIPPAFLPSRPTLENYFDLFVRRPFLTYCLNSFIIASLSSLLCVAAASPAAWWLARSGRRSRAAVSGMLLGLAFFPPIVFVFPLYELLRVLGLINYSLSRFSHHASLCLPLWLRVLP